jgi:Fe-S-cluster-containing dehydrogenase component
MIIDVAKCEDCNNCFLACKDEFVDNDFLPYSLLSPARSEMDRFLTRKEANAPLLMLLIFHVMYALR